MISKTAATTRRASGYTLLVTHRNTWRIYDDKNKNKENTRQHLEQYYFHEDASNDKTCKRLQMSFPYHHCLTKASHHSSQTVLDAQCLYPYFRTKNQKQQTNWQYRDLDRTPVLIYQSLSELQVCYLFHLL